MLKEIKLYGWKSFEEAQLFLDPLTVLIGLNASGKSNALDALQFLQRSVVHRDLYTALAGEGGYQSGIRGGLEWVALRGRDTFKIETRFGTADPNLDYHYSLEVSIIRQNPISVQIKSESLSAIWKRKRADDRWQKLFWTDDMAGIKNPIVTVRLANRRGVPVDLSSSTSALSQLRLLNQKEEIKKAVELVALTLENIFILDPIPQNARGFSQIESKLRADGSNLAGVIASMEPNKKEQIENVISQYAQKLPEREIERVWVESVGRLNTDVMLYCEEEILPGRLETVDARGLSDGTIRFLIVLTAILTRPYGSLLVIEEIDNGIHPSRAKLLLNILRTEGEKVGVDILVTTHNPAFLDQLIPKLLPFVMLVHRDTETGSSKITPLEDAEKLHFLMGKGSLGDIATNEHWYEELITN